MPITGYKSGLNVKTVVYATDFSIGTQNADRLVWNSGISVKHHLK
jgi:hypothetical protein